MNIATKENCIVIDQISSIDDCLEKLNLEQDTFTQLNLIIDLQSVSNITIDILKQFSTISKLQKKNKKSFVIVAKDINFSKVPASLNVVPTFVEAQDIIELEEIERDLGF